MSEEETPEKKYFIRMRRADPGDIIKRSQEKTHFTQEELNNLKDLDLAERKTNDSD
jgi:hypothetical protein